ncbi:MAG: CPBP family intramembrane metalloprotease [bacterium]|nr:CPBP family intramembrane metalloprotease [bacterium]
MRNASRQLLIRAVLLEGFLIGIAAVWAFLRNIPVRNSFSITVPGSLLGISVGLFLLGANYLLVEYGSRYFAFFRRIKRLIEDEISPLFRQIDLSTIALIALVSGLAEELLFRGVLQAEIGIWFSSILFGAAHVWRKAAIVYGIYAAAIGLFFGAIYLWSGNLWVPALAHMVNNFAALLYYEHYLTKAKRPVVSGQTPF